MDFIINHSMCYMIGGIAISLAFMISLMPMYIGKIRKNIVEEDKNKKIAISKTEMFVRLISFFIPTLIILIIQFFMIPDTSAAILSKELVFGLGVGCFTSLALLDLKYGEVYVYELGIANTLLMFVIPIILNFIFGCKCVSIGLLVTFAVYIVAKILNYIFNKELSVGGADVDCIASLFLANISLFLAFRIREENSIFMETFYIEKLFTMIFINFATSIILYFGIKIYKKIKNKDKNKESKMESEDKKVLNTLQMINQKKTKKNLDFRCLPSFVLIYGLTLFMILFY